MNPGFPPTGIHERSFFMLVPYSWFQILWYFYIYGFLG